MNKRVCSSFYGCIVLLLFPVCGQARETVNFDFDWKFKLNREASRKQIPINTE